MMHKKAVSLLKDMLSIYNVSHWSKKVKEPVNSEDLGHFIFFMGWVVLFLWPFHVKYFLRETLLSLNNETLVMMILTSAVISILLMLVSTLFFFIDFSNKGAFKKLQIIATTLKTFFAKGCWKLSKGFIFYFLRRKIKKVSDNLGEIYPSIYEFFRRKSSLHLLESLVDEMRLPVNDTNDYSKRLKELIYEFENTALFPSMDELDHKDVVKKEDENIAFFKVVGSEKV